MSVRYALLGLLHEEPDYGYSLQKRFEEAVGEVWRLNLGQVYQTLRALESAGLVSEADPSAAVDELDHPARRKFRATKAGLETMNRWLRRKPVVPLPLRDELLIQLLILECGGDLDAVRRIEAQRKVYERHLARLRARLRKLPPDDEDPRLVARLGLEAAMFHAEAHLRWLERCRERIEIRAAMGPRRTDETGE